MVTSSLLVTSRPSPPVPCPWFLKLRIVLSGPLPRTVTSLTSSESVERNSNRPAPNLDRIARLGVDHRRLGLLRGIGAGIDDDPARAAALVDGGETPPDDEAALGNRLLGATGDENRGTAEGRSRDYSRRARQISPDEVPIPGPPWSTPGQLHRGRGPDFDSIPAPRRTPTHPGIDI